MGEGSDRCQLRGEAHHWGGECGVENMREGRLSASVRTGKEEIGSDSEDTRGHGKLSYTRERWEARQANSAEGTKSLNNKRERGKGEKKKNS